MSFIDEIKYSFKGHNNFNVLIYINLIFFVVIQLVKVFLFFNAGGDVEFISWLAIPSDMQMLTHRPWTVITYMFTHENFLHLLFNLLAFYWFGKIFLQYLSQRQLLGIYILGGIAGAIFYVAAFNLIPVFAPLTSVSLALGASASVMAVVFAVATLVPNQEVYLMFFGKVKFKYIAIAFVFIDIVSIPLSNAGGHIAHLGGALLGFIFVINYKKGTDITIWISRFLYGIKELFVRKKDIKITCRNKDKTRNNRSESDMDYNARKKAEQDAIDKILDKIAQSGYPSLSADEKEKLFKVSNKK